MIRDRSCQATRGVGSGECADWGLHLARRSVGILVSPPRRQPRVMSKRRRSPVHKLSEPIEPRLPAEARTVGRGSFYLRPPSFTPDFLPFSPLVGKRWVVKDDHSRNHWPVIHRHPLRALPPASRPLHQPGWRRGYAGSVHTLPVTDLELKAVWRRGRFPSPAS